MSLIKPAASKFSITRTGLQIHGQPTFVEWSAVAPKFGEALRSMAFVIGDWLAYGEANFRSGPIARRVSSEAYDAAVAATGLDRSTMHNYAYVARRVAQAHRSEILSWQHHKVVAKLPAPEQKRWLKLASPGKNERPISTHRLQKSILAGRVLTVEEAVPDPRDKGIENHIPYVNRLDALWRGMKESGWLQRSTPEKREALLSDISPVMKMYIEIHSYKSGPRR